MCECHCINGIRVGVPNCANRSTNWRQFVLGPRGGVCVVCKQIVECEAAYT